MDVHKLLLVAAVIVAAASIAGTAGATPGTGTVAPIGTTTTVGFIPDPGVTITTDPSKAPAHKGPIVSPRILCGTCNGGGNVQGCATVYTTGSDGYGNWVRAFYHWCWLNGAISSNYGWQDEAACAFVCNFQGWNYNFDFPYGHQEKGTFRDVSAGPAHYDTTAATCVAVDGWGNSWGC
jgi:hypothetical protein